MKASTIFLFRKKQFRKIASECANRKEFIYRCLNEVDLPLFHQLDMYEKIEIYEMALRELAHIKDYGWIPNISNKNE